MARVPPAGRGCTPGGSWLASVFAQTRRHAPMRARAEIGWERNSVSVVGAVEHEPPHKRVSTQQEAGLDYCTERIPAFMRCQRQQAEHQAIEANADNRTRLGDVLHKLAIGATLLSRVSSRPATRAYIREVIAQPVGLRLSALNQAQLWTLASCAHLAWLSSAMRARFRSSPCGGSSAGVVDSCAGSGKRNRSVCQSGACR